MVSIRAVMTRDEERRAQFVRQWRVLVTLRQGPRTLRELAQLLDVHPRTVRRDLYALQRVPLPVSSRFDGASRQGIRRGDPNVWCLGETPAWPRDAPFPVAELRQCFREVTDL